jgi:hypothetical protein
MTPRRGMYPHGADKGNMKFIVLRHLCQCPRQQVALISLQAIGHFCCGPCIHTSDFCVGWDTNKVAFF